MAIAQKLHNQLVLASASPRRRQLLAEAGYSFKVIPPPVNEPPTPANCQLSATAWAEALAYFKARAVAQTCTNAIIIGADTIVEHDGTIIGKATDQDHARRILSTQFIGDNNVITGLAVLYPKLKKRIITHITTLVVMRKMTDTELEEYLDSGAWQDKAGAYALQEGGDRFVKKIEGSQSNVVGLPMEKLNEILTSR